MGSSQSVTNIRELVQKRALGVITNALLEQSRTVSQELRREQVLENVTVNPTATCPWPTVPGAYNVVNKARVDANEAPGFF